MRGSLPLVAKALGRKYGLNVVISSKVGAPHTDGRTIYLPALPPSNADKAEVWLNGFIDHEAGHVRFTDFESLKGLTKLELLFANVLEDPRIERCMTETYPGCRYNFDDMYELMASKENGRVAKASQDSLQLITHGLLDKLMLEVNQRKGMTTVLWGRVEMLLGQALAKQILDIALPVGFSNDPTAAAKGAKEIVELLKQANQVQEQPQDGDEDQEGAGDEAGDSAGNCDQGSGSGKPSQSSQSQKPSKNAATKGQPVTRVPGGDAGNTSGSSSDGSNGTPGADEDGSEQGDGEENPSGLEAALEGTHTGYEAIDAILTCTDDEIDAVADELGADKAAAEKIEEISSRAQETFSDEEIVPSSWKSNPQAVTLLGVESVAKALKYRLEDTLQHRLEEGYYTRATGTRMLRRRVGLYEAGARKVFKFKEDQETMNTAIYVTCDISGSMHGRSLDQAKIATICIGDALNGFEGLNYCVSSFDTRVFTYPETWLKARQQIAATPAQGGTLFGPALIHGLDWLAQVEQERKLLVLITDGEPGDPKSADFLLKSAERDGIELYGLAIAGSISNHLRSLFGNRVGLVSDVKQLPHLLGDLIEQSI